MDETTQTDGIVRETWHLTFDTGETAEVTAYEDPVMAEHGIEYAHAEVLLPEDPPHTERVQCRGETHDAVRYLVANVCNRGWLVTHVSRPREHTPALTLHIHLPPADTGVRMAAEQIARVLDEAVRSGRVGNP